MRDPRGVGGQDRETPSEEWSLSAMGHSGVVWGLPHLLYARWGEGVSTPCTGRGN